MSLASPSLQNIEGDVFTPFHRGGTGSPLVCLHGFTDTWRTWELMLPWLEGRHDVLAPTLPGHAGGAPLEDEMSHDLVADAVEAMMDEIGFETAHIVGNSLGGFVALQLAARGRARSVVAFAPAGGWPENDGGFDDELLDHFENLQQLAQAAAPYADAVVASVEGRRRATQMITSNFEHIPEQLIIHQILGVACCDGMEEMLRYASRETWTLDVDRIECPVRLVWGTADQILPLPDFAARYRNEWLPLADWVELEGVGHCPQLDVPLESSELILSFTD